jgi:uncharacterized protein
VELDGMRVAMVHDRAHWRPDDREPVGAGVDVLVSGHTHVPTIEAFAGLVHLNPGSASSPGHGRTPTVAFLEAVAGRPQARIEPLWEK